MRYAVLRADLSSVVYHNRSSWLIEFLVHPEAVLESTDRWIIMVDGKLQSKLARSMSPD